MTFAATVVPQLGGAVSAAVQFIEVKDGNDDGRDEALESGSDQGAEVQILSPQPINPFQSAIT